MLFMLLAPYILPAPVQDLGGLPRLPESSRRRVGAPSASSHVGLDGQPDGPPPSNRKHEHVMLYVITEQTEIDWEGLRDRVSKLVEKLGHLAPGLALTAVIEAASHAKARAAGELVRFIEERLEVAAGQAPGLATGTDLRAEARRLVAPPDHEHDAPIHIQPELQPASQLTTQLTTVFGAYFMVPALCPISPCACCAAFTLIDHALKVLQVLLSPAAAVMAAHAILAVKAMAPKPLTEDQQKRVPRRCLTMV